MKEKIYIVKEHICSGESEFTAAGKARIDVEDILYDWKACLLYTSGAADE